eukprot:132724_1
MVYMLFGLVCSFVSIIMANTAIYNEDTALTAVYYAFGAYCAVGSLQNWDCEPYCHRRPHFAIHSVITGKKYKLQAFTGYDPQTKQIVISFQGTKTNFNLLEDFDWEQVYFKAGEKYKTAGGDWAIHQAFYYELLELYEEGLLASLQELFTQYKEGNVLITGHSLGGALAQMLALMFVTTPTFASFSIGHVEIITFGSPRWGSKDLITYFNTLPHTNWRIVNKYDLIPTMPWISMGDYGYYHASREVKYTKWGTLKHQMCDGRGDVPNGCGVNDDVSYDKKYHVYYLNVFEGYCGGRKPKDEWFSELNTSYTTLPVVDDISTSVAMSTLNPEQTEELTTIATEHKKHAQGSQHSNWMVIVFVCVGAFGCLLVVFCVMKLYQKSKRKARHKDYVAIDDVYADI